VSVQPPDARLMPPAAMAEPAEREDPGVTVRRSTSDGLIVEVAGEIHDDDLGVMRPCVSLRMPGHVAHNLSHLLADWSTIGELMESGRGADETELAALLHDAAHHTGDRETRRCDQPLNVE